MAFKPRNEATEHTVADGETLESLATTAGITVAELTLFNYGTSQAKEVDRALFELVGCRTRNAAGTSYVFSSSDGTRGTGKILIPKKFTAADLAAGRTYVAELRPLLPMCAIDIGKLDKWFLPGEASDGGEACTLNYELEGVATVADKVAFDVYGSGYCSASVDGDGKLHFADVDPTLPVFKQALDAAKAVPRSAQAVDDWRGQTNAESGMLKPRAGEKRHIDVAFSPYTALLRFYREDADKQARLRLEDFWIRWNGAGALIADSLKIRWHVEQCDRLEYGQLIVVDKTDKVVFRDALKREHLTAGRHVYTWSGKLTDGTDPLPAQMPYRVQIQAHTKLGEAAGVALAAMHTEVRLFTDPATGAHADQPFLDPSSLELKLAPIVTEVPTRDGDVKKWYQYRLAQAGFHPGPIDGDLDRVDTKVALKEFQRTYPRTKSDGTYERLEPSGSRDSKTTEVLATLPDNARPLFGDPTSRADVIDPAALNGKLTNPADANGLILWVDDRHYYTSSVPKGFPSNFDLGNYRPGMDIGDASADRDGECIARPWIPLQVDLPLLKKDTALAGLASVDKATNVASRKALGPLRVDWVFEEAPKELSVFDLANPNYDITQVRSRKWVEATLDATRATQGTRHFENCPADKGGIRPASLDDYYKVLVGYGADSLRPWVAYDDPGTKAVGAVVHDDYGQAAAQLYPEHRGRVGAYFRPSRVGGDGYRFGARVAFDQVPGAPSQFGNWEILRRRYPKVPQAYSCPLRVWRKTAYRAHLTWCEAGKDNWAGANGPTTDLYRPAFLHFAQELSRTSGVFVQETASNLVGQADYRRVILDTVSSSYRSLNVTLDAHHVWPFLSAKRWGIPVSAPGVRLPDFYRRVLDPLFNDTWRKFREQLIWLVLAKTELRHGLLKGHLLVEFTDSPSGTVWEYRCPRCHQYFVEMIEQLPVAERMDQLPCPACGTGKGGSGIKPVKTGDDTSSLMLPAVGVGMGATWLFTPATGPLWAHEMGHHRHLEHAQAWPGQTSVAPGAKNIQHDPVPNTVKYGAAAAGKDQCWDRQCVMSYSHGKQYFCGKCVLKNRGWKVEGLPTQPGGVHD